MKIAYDAKRFFQNASGLGNYSRDLLRILSNLFPENSYVLVSEKFSERGAEIVARNNVEILNLKGKFARQLSAGVAAQSAGAAIYHGLSGELPMRWGTMPIKKVVTIHDLIFLRYPEFYSFFDRKIHFWKFKKAAEQADVVIAISEQTRQDIIQFLKVPEGKIRVVYQGCHQAFRENYSEAAIQAVRGKFKLPARFVLNVGTIEARKNLLNIVKALQGTGIPLVVVGKPTAYYKVVKTYIDKHNLSEQILFLEGVDIQELACLYRMADVFVYPSLFEGFGIPVIEALFSGTPIVTSNRSCLPEAGGRAALYINPEDFKDIRSKILHLWDNTAERRRLIELGDQHALQFEDEAVAYQMMEVYKSLL